MPTTSADNLTASPATRGPRRLSKDARRAQLIAAAMPLVARSGFSDFSLDEVAERADVTRNLLYHYFPDGRNDIVRAVAEQAGHILTDDWVTDESIPLAERLATNNSRIVAHAMEPSDAWVIYQLARSSTDPELRTAVDHFVEIVVSNLQVVASILSPRRNNIQPHFLRVRSRQNTALGQVLLANSITLTPGTVTVGLDNGELLVHALSTASGAAVVEGQLDAMIPPDLEEIAS